MLENKVCVNKSGYLELKEEKMSYNANKEQIEM